ncbi:MAG: pantetheine-phosphate adenylyltransferase, partial [Candidatus Dormibacteraceae bacterium]
VLGLARQLFEEVVIGVAINSEKRKTLFSAEERVEMIEESVASQSGVTVTSYSGLTVEFARQQEIRSLIRGLRVFSDFEDELQQAMMNRKLAPEIITIFLTPSSSNLFLSSRLIKEVAAGDGEVGELVPTPVARRLRSAFR